MSSYEILHSFGQGAKKELYETGHDFKTKFSPDSFLFNKLSPTFLLGNMLFLILFREWMFPTLSFKERRSLEIFSSLLLAHKTFNKREREEEEDQNA